MTTKISAETFISGADMGGFIWPFVIAGGSLRDSWFGKEVNDLDVFVAIPDSRMNDVRKQGWFNLIMDETGLPHSIFATSPVVKGQGAVKFFQDGADFYDSSKFISGKSPEVPGVNIILRSIEDIPPLYVPAGVYYTSLMQEEELVEALFQEFPCSISRIAWHPVHNKWWIHKSFEESLNTKVVMFHHNVTDKYYKKIFPKYKDIFKWELDGGDPF